MTIRKRMLVILLAASLPGMAVAMFLAGNALRNESQQIGVSAERLAKLQAAQHETVMGNAQVLLETVVQATRAVGSDVDVVCSRWLNNWVYQSFTSLTYFAPSGRVVCSSADGELAEEAGDAAWFREAVEKDRFVVGNYTRGRSGMPLIVAAQPVRNSEGEFEGVLGVGIELKWMGYLTGSIDLPPEASVTAFDRAGTVIFHEAGDLPSVSGPLAELLRNREPAAPAGVLLWRNQSGDERLYGYAGTKTGGVTVVVGLPRFSAFERVGEALLNTLAAPMAILVLALVATGWASERFVTRWVRSLTDTAESVAEGELSARTSVPYSQDEIGQLALAFDEMAEAIERQHDENRSLVVQREGLLRELNHRVANNFLVLSSIIAVAKKRLRGNENPDLVLRDLAGRVRTLAEVHRLLYNRMEHAEPLERAKAVERLIDLLVEFYAGDRNSVTVEARIDPIDLGLDRSVAFSLLLNELICNAFKHAFRQHDRGEGRLSIICRRLARRRAIELTVTDNGAGLPKGFDYEAANTTGFDIIRSLVDQLGGKLALARERPGTRVTVVIPEVEKAEPRAA